MGTETFDIKCVRYGPPKDETEFTTSNYLWFNLNGVPTIGKINGYGVIEGSIPPIESALITVEQVDAPGTRHSLTYTGSKANPVFEEGVRIAYWSEVKAYIDEKLRIQQAKVPSLWATIRNWRQQKNDFAALQSGCAAFYPPR